MNNQQWLRELVFLLMDIASYWEEDPHYKKEHKALLAAVDELERLTSEGRRKDAVVEAARAFIDDPCPLLQGELKDELIGLALVSEELPLSTDELHSYGLKVDDDRPSEEIIRELRKHDADSEEQPGVDYPVGDGTTDNTQYFQKQVDKDRD